MHNVYSLRCRHVHIILCGRMGFVARLLEYWRGILARFRSPDSSTQLSSLVWTADDCCWGSKCKPQVLEEHRSPISDWGHSSEIILHRSYIVPSYSGLEDRLHLSPKLLGFFSPIFKGQTIGLPRHINASHCHIEMLRMIMSIAWDKRFFLLQNCSRVLFWRACMVPDSSIVERKQNWSPFYAAIRIIALHKRIIALIWVHFIPVHHSVD